ncbi:hypothetical protein KsCSTR_16430 [Candidatus Kuenenia stuttgartiensis]|uniref:Glycosyl transferase family 1 domain-containing protein n=1 Tax=Kuenenia stuttgartiensis TaxID=174633 RepID=Q1Q1U8_KUEST|nr:MULTISPECIES: glycosyltransferase [Kuenenia]MCZ7621587.1 glycosyltransferase [Candidatus Kuenenia sp.]QII11022.1 hypothetical protein KsCSTR_16430 [Candidatus Kuenenia stuttgartiensis]CAJ73992.1 unknown protein [Candidatus Kuenenia stuttgartiensis]
MKENKTKLPGRVLIVTSGYPPIIGGSSTVFINLLGNIDPSTFVILTKSWGYGLGMEKPKGYNVYRVPRLKYTFLRGQRYWEPLIKHFVVSRIVKMGMRAIREMKCTGILAAFPCLPYMEAGYLLAKKSGLPFSVYLHDTVLEANVGQLFYENWARKIQDLIFPKAKPIFVMSEGIKQFYKTQYCMDTIVLSHCFNEPLPQEYDSESTNKNNIINLFFGGNIYRTCLSALKNIFVAIKNEPDIHITISNPYTLHPGLSLPDNRLHHCFSSERYDFLRKLMQSDVTIVPLGFTKEVHHGEISTIFPTKCIEYFWAGKPILVHCPKDYFLARFFEEHECGMVVSDPDPQTIRDAIRKLINDNELRAKFIKGARKALSLFDGKRVAEILSDNLFKR